jgi:hypothetical protein
MHERQACKYTIVILLFIELCHAFELRAVYSRFSGLVTDDIIVGSDQEAIRVSIDFGSSSNILFSPDVCPLFVACFDSTRSTTFSSKKQLKQYPISSMFGWDATEYIDIGDDGLVEQYPLFYVSRWDSETVDLKEVAGVIGAGPDSRLFRGTIVELNDAVPEFNGIRIRTVSWGDANHRTDFLVPSKVLGSKWRSSVLLSVKDHDLGGMIPSELYFDPSIEDLILPFTMKGYLLSKLSRARITSGISDDFLYMSCSLSTDPDIDISLRFSSGEIQLINSLLMELPIVEHPKMSGLCRTRIRFSKYQVDYISVGRLLIRSVSAVFLNYDSSLIGIESRASNAILESQPVALPEPLIPLYQLPQINVEETTRNASVQFNRSIHGTLILSSLKAVNGCWTFFRTFPTTDLNRDIEVPGDFNETYYRIRNGFIAFNFSTQSSGAKKLKGVIRMRNRTVQVCKI